MTAYHIRHQIYEVRERKISAAFWHIEADIQDAIYKGENVIYRRWLKSDLPFNFLVCLRDRLRDMYGYESNNLELWLGRDYVYLTVRL